MKIPLKFVSTPPANKKINEVAKKKKKKISAFMT